MNKMCKKNDKQHINLYKNLTGDNCTPFFSAGSIEIFLKSSDLYIFLLSVKNILHII